MSGDDSKGGSAPGSTAWFVYACLYANMSLYAFCYMMQQPVLPKMVDTYAGGEEGKLAWAKLQSSFAAVQLVGGLLAGLLSDIFGAKSLLVISAAASVAVYAGQAAATSMDGLYLSQLPGVMQHAFMATAAYITAITTLQTRSQSLSYIQMAYGIGMATGPLLGGYLGETDIRTSSSLASGLSAVGALLLLMLPPAHSAGVAEADAAAPQAQQQKGGVSASKVLAAVRRPGVLRAILRKVFAASAMGTWQSTFAVVAKTSFGFGPQFQGYFLSYVSVVGMVVIGARSIQRLEARLSDRGVNVAMGLVLAACFAVMPLTVRLSGGEGGVQLMLGALGVLLVPVTACTTVLRSTTTSQLTKAAPQELSGTMIGIDMAIASAMRIVAPGAGMYAMEYGFQGLGLYCAALMLCMVAVAFLGEGAKGKQD